MSDVVYASSKELGKFVSPSRGICECCLLVMAEDKALPALREVV